MLATTCMQFYKLAKKEHVCSFMQFHNTHVGAAHKIFKCLFDFYGTFKPFEDEMASMEP